nr:SIS domain-containing protein [uncultured Albidiferax sp.]
MTWMHKETMACADVAALAIDAVIPQLVAEGSYWRASGIRHVEVLGRGSSSHMGTLLRYGLSELCGLSTSAAMPWIAQGGDSSVFNPSLPSTLVAISQSGGSPDLVAYAKLRAKLGARVVGLINSRNSPLGAVCAEEFDLGAGKELAVAATKTTFAAGLSALGLVAGYLGEAGGGLRAAIARLPGRVREAQLHEWAALVDSIVGAKTVFILGRGATFGVAKEVALKISEATGIPAVAYSAAEFLHGPMAAASSRTPVLALCSDPQSLPSVMVALGRAAEYGAPTLLASTGKFSGMDQGSSTLLPATEFDHAYVDALLLLVPAYLAIERAAVGLGRNPDAPRGLAKVTQTL